MSTHIAGIILRARSKKTTAKFYSALGLALREHSHGGPLHHECTDFSLESVMEIYEQSEKRSKDALLIEVDSIEQILPVLKEFNIETETTQEKYGMKFLYFTDPDNRLVMLIENIYAIHTN